LREPRAAARVGRELPEKKVKEKKVKEKKLQEKKMKEREKKVTTVVLEEEPEIVLRMEQPDALLETEEPAPPGEETRAAAPAARRGRGRPRGPRPVAARAPSILVFHVLRNVVAFQRNGAPAPAASRLRWLMRSSARWCVNTSRWRRGCWPDWTADGVSEWQKVRPLVFWAFSDKSRFGTNLAL
jgi:outer membrane biosynthesis protein TonB